MNRKRIFRYVKALRTVLVIIFTWCFFFYPAITTLTVALDPDVRNGEISDFSINHFVKTSQRFEKWASHYIESQRAINVDFLNCAETEWPMFGSVYYLVAAEEIQKQLKDTDRLDRKTNEIFKKAANAAAEIIADPKSGTWVQRKWGDTYRSKENVFYRMLLIMGLSSYENITQDKTYRTLLYEQATSLGSELMKTKTHLLNDYPGECYPNDVLWAVAAMLRTDKLIGTDHSLLKSAVLKVLNSKTLTKEGVPAYAADARTGRPASVARGCANSGILVFTPELDVQIAEDWYSNHEKYFWQEHNIVRGFREYTKDYSHSRRDVDTGPIIAGYGSVASIFGIGAARGVGRLDHSVPLTMETIAVSWPTPFGFMIPDAISYFAADTWCMGDVTILFLMTRPILSDNVAPFDGNVPGIVWLACLLYFAFGCVCLWREYRYWRK